jgi:hypothetical protein
MDLRTFAAASVVAALVGSTACSWAADVAESQIPTPDAEAPAAERETSPQPTEAVNEELAAPGAELPANEPAGEITSPESFSEAETVLWLTDQLKNIAKPSRLQYEFKKVGTLEEGFTDSVQLDIVELLPDGMKKANVNFFTGARNHYVPPYESINGNPLLAIFLHGDVLEMNRLTDGGWRYFHRRIKFAFADGAQITPVEIEFDGRKIAGKQVRITPYVDDPQTELSEKFRKLKDKVYLVTVSDDIPGYLYEIRTVVPAPQDAGVGAGPLIEEYLKLVSVEEM